jgi:hypothetical protein
VIGKLKISGLPFAAFIAVCAAQAASQEPAVPSDTQAVFDEVATIIGSNDIALINARFEDMASTLGTKTEIRFTKLSGETMLQELDGCTYSGGRNINGMLRMLWTCENRKPPSACYSGNILMRVFGVIEPATTLDLAEELIGDFVSCRPAPPKILIKSLDSD